MYTLGNFGLKGPGVSLNIKLSTAKLHGLIGKLVYKGGCRI